MAKSEVILPAMGEGIIEATIMKWLVEVGSEVTEDEPLVEIATDKVDSEIPSPISGILTKIIYREGEIPKVGEVIAIINSDVDEVANNNEALIVKTDSLDEQSSEDFSAELLDEYEAKGEQNNIQDTKKLFSPFIRLLAKQREISLAELNRIKGTGLENRITRDDLYEYIKKGRSYKDLSGAGYNMNLSELVVQDKNELPYVPQAGEKLIPMDRTRKLIAEHMVRSKRTSPHVTSMIEVDITHVVNWRENFKAKFLNDFGTPITYTALILEAVAKSLKLYPGINVSVAGDYIVQKENINIGVATALENGNLIVPVIRNADRLNLPALAQSIYDLADRARRGKLDPKDIKGGTFTITNMGQFGNITGTPIINQPEVAILAVGAIKKKPGVIIVNNQETIGVRDIIVLSLTYDHRVLDGALGGLFLKSIGDNLAGFSTSFW